MPAISTASERDEAYAPLEAPDILPLLALLCFAGSLASRVLVRLLPDAWRVYPWGATLPVFLAALLALVGFAMALYSSRRRRRRGLARLALFLNGVVLFLTSLAAAGMIWIVGH